MNKEQQIDKLAKATKDLKQYLKKGTFDGDAISRICHRICHPKWDTSDAHLVLFNICEEISEILISISKILKENKS